MSIIDFIFVVFMSVYFTFIDPVDEQIRLKSFGVKFFICLILLMFFTGAVFYLNYFFNFICNILLSGRG